MNKKEVLIEIEKYLNDEPNNVWNFLSDDNNEILYMKNTVKRLVKTYDKYKNNEVSKDDYLVSLRNFLLTFQTKINLENKEILNDNDFYLNIDSEGKVYTTLQCPSKIKHPQFVADTFCPEINAKKAVGESELQTNPFIYNLSGKNFKHFKSLEQKLAVQGAYNTPDGYTTLISMPTGGGKSLVTQTMAYLSDGLTIVVVPTVSLSIDQERVAKLNIKGNKEGEIYSYFSKRKDVKNIIEAIEKNICKLLFISPEALIGNELFKNSIEQANKIGKLKNIIIDEAHMIVEWGDLFRVDYQCLESWRNNLLKVNPKLKTILLSATFSIETTNTLKKMFAEKNNKWIEIRCDSLRKEPKFIVIKTNEAEKNSKLVSLIRLLPRPMIVYVNSPNDAEYYKKLFNKNGFDNIYTFTGQTKSNERQELISKWTDDDFDLMIATSAFGVGVDKPDVRTVIHTFIPESADSYYQELGRGGRDGLTSLSVVCINKNEESKTNSHIKKVITTKKFIERWDSMNDKSVKQNGITEIDTSVKPSYSKKEYYEKGNEQDENWNINILLLLRRYDLISIENIDKNANDNYIFSIKINDNRITTKNKIREELFESIRTKELERNNKSYELLKKQVKNLNMCWSEMFYEIYPYVDEYCAGCENHETVNRDDCDGKPLKAKLTEPLYKIDESAINLFQTTSELLFINRSKLPFDDIIKESNKYSPNIFVTKEKVENLLKSNYKNISSFLTLDEFMRLFKQQDYYFTSGVIVFDYQKLTSKDIEKQYNISQKAIKETNSKIIHIVDDDYYVNLKEKNISELINGSVIEK